MSMFAIRQLPCGKASQHPDLTGDGCCLNGLSSCGLASWLVPGGCGVGGAALWSCQSTGYNDSAINSRMRDRFAGSWHPSQKWRCPADSAAMAGRWPNRHAIIRAVWLVEVVADKCLLPNRMNETHGDDAGCAGKADGRVTMLKTGEVCAGRHWLVGAGSSRW